MEAEAGTRCGWETARDGGLRDAGLRDASSVEPTGLAHGRWASAELELRARLDLSRFRLSLTQHPPVPANARAPGPGRVPPKFPALVKAKLLGDKVLEASRRLRTREWG